MKPRIKSFYRIYRREGEDAIFIGQGPDKFAIDEPTDAMSRFVERLDGTRSSEELACEFSEANGWLGDLMAAGVIEDADDERETIEDRYVRQLNYLRLFEREGWSGSSAQNRLADARVVVAGTGAGGTTLLRLLNAAGIGTLEAIDFDDVEADNLSTHATFDEADVGRPKLAAVRSHLERQNSRTHIICHEMRIGSADDLAEVAAGADFLLQAFDRPREASSAARWTNEAGLRVGLPFASIGATDKGARAGPIVLPGESACFECVGLPDLEFLRFEEAQALTAATVFMLAGIMVNEVVKVLTDAAPSRLVGRSLYVDTESLRFQFTEHQRSAGCICDAAGSHGEPARVAHARD